ncbi:MAG TPA: AIR synthase related protein, partial [Chitinophagaceae bacterium]|nr:AIR synthase related protein [Chitinophagaceae bacterium]
KEIKEFNIDTIEDVNDLKAITEQLIQIPNIASKRWIYNQYDSMVGTANASTNAPSDAAIILAKGTGKALAVTVDCNSRYVFANPFVGAMIAVAEAARNIVCSGGEPIGVTNCLNFGNPYDPEVYYQFVKAVTGMGDACRKFNTPVTGGNVSFYNQSPEGAVYPTPTIGMVGILDNIDNKMTLSFKSEGDIIVLIGEQKNDIASSEYLHKIKKIEYSDVPYFDLDEEFKIQQFIALIINKKLIQSAHDISEGGLIITLMEKGFYNNLGFSISYNTTIRKDAYWFGEAQSRVVVTVANSNYESFKTFITKANIPFTQIGTVTAGEIEINNDKWDNILVWKEKYDTAIEKHLN